MAIEKKHLVEKRNVLNEIRRNNMTLQEMRFFSIYLSKINARDVNTRKVRFPLKDFQKIMELGRMNITHFQNVTNNLLGKVVNVRNERGGYTGFQLFKECTVDKDEFEQWYVEIDAHDKALPLMFDFKKEYFTYELWNALRLKSGNQLRMYELLKQYEKVGERKIPLSELKELLGIGEKEYPRWDRFKDRVLISCQQALEEYTDIKFEFEPIKSGRKITGVHFIIKKNENYVDQLTLDDFIELQPEVGLVEDTAEDPFQAEPEEHDPFIVSFEEEPVKEEPKYINKHVDFLASACEYEFDGLEMEAILEEMKGKNIGDFFDLQGKEEAQYHFLVKCYAQLKLKARKQPIYDRHAYFLGIIKNME